MSNIPKRLRSLVSAAALAALVFPMLQPAAASAATVIVNGDFETGNLTGWTPSGTASVTNSGAHTGTYAALLGSTSPTNGDSSISQTFTAPSGTNTLSFWYQVTCPDTLTYDWATATLRDNTASTTSTVLPKTCTNGAGWQQVTASLTGSHSYTLTLINHDDNYPGDATYTRYDDVAVTTSTPPPGLTQVSTDPYTNSTSQHATEVEPGTFAWGSTIVSAFQSGRFTDGGASNIGWATSTNGGSTWQKGFLPGITTYAGGSYARVSDPTVAYDAKHNTWLIATLPINSATQGVGAAVNRSTNGGLSWSGPTMAIGNNGDFWDKDWIVCDNTSTSAFYGNCYVEADDVTTGDVVYTAVSSDGGSTWGPARQPADAPTGLGGQPLVQPNGTVVVPYLSLGGQIRAYTSTNGGASWNSTVAVASVSSSTIGGSLRASTLPSAEVNGAGNVYVAWHDCRFRSGCTSNDIVYSTSSNGTSWGAVTRVPIDATTSSVDHFIPGFGVDRATSGGTTHLGVYYYFYPNANCSASTCQLEVGYVSSTNGGASWSAPQTVAGPMSLSQIASTNQGPMVGDYIATAFSGGKAVSVFAVGRTPTNGQAYDLSMYTVGGLATTGGTIQSSSTNVQLVPTTERIPALTLQ
jgi:hypothetical protein